MNAHWPGLTTVLVGVIACGTGTHPAVQTAPQPPATVYVSGAGAEVRLSATGRTVEDEVYAPIAEAWPALLAALEALDIPIADQDAVRRTVRSKAFRMPRQIEGRRRAELLDCGSTMTGLRADVWDVTIEVVAALTVINPARTRVSTLVTAAAKPREGTSTSSVSCQSKGELEKIIVRQLAEHTDS